MAADISADARQPAFRLPELVLLGCVFAIAAFATDMYQPAFPSIRRTFSSSASDVQFSLSLFLYGNAVGHLVFGPMSDRFGRKPVLIAGLITYTVATLCCATAASIDSFLLFRALQGAAAASGPVLIRALINDRLARNEAAQMLALLTGFMALTAMLTPIAGGWLVQHQGWRWIFYTIGLFALALVVLCARLTRETLPPARRLTVLGPTTIARGYFNIVRSMEFWIYVTPPALMFSAVFAYVGINSFLLIEQLGLSAQQQGMSFSLAAAAYVAGSFTSNRLVHRLGIERAVTSGLLLGIVTAGAATMASTTLPLSFALVLTPALGLFFATALIVPIALSAAVSQFPTHAGSASAVAGFTQLVCAGASSALAAWLVDGTTGPLHLYSLCACLLAAVCWFGGRGRRRRTGNSG